LILVEDLADGPNEDLEEDSEAEDIDDAYLDSLEDEADDSR
jgi:hypothetical protein